MNPQREAKYQRCVNIWTSRAIPVIIFALAPWALSVLTRLIIKEHPSHLPVLVIAYVLYVLWLIPFLRLLYTVTFDPGFTDDKRPQEQKKKKKSKSKSDSPEKPAADFNYDAAEVAQGRQRAPSGLKNFYRKDVFICDQYGLPIYCIYCHNWKPDRTHHCSEVDRCVLRFDHFCPWVGGVLGERSMKFFLQFLVYAGIWTTFFASYMIYASWYQYKHEPRSDIRTGIRSEAAGATAASGFLGLIAVGMAMTTAWFAWYNMTTNENMAKRADFVAVRIPRDLDRGNIEHLGTITYPLPNQPVRRSSHQSEAESTLSSSEPRTFAILQTKPADNIWDVGSLQNMKCILGHHWWDWILPLRKGPAADPDDPVSDYPLGRDFDKICREAGIPHPGRGVQEAGG